MFLSEVWLEVIHRQKLHRPHSNVAQPARCSCNGWRLNSMSWPKKAGLFLEKNIAGELSPRSIAAAAVESVIKLQAKKSHRHARPLR